MGIDRLKLTLVGVGGSVQPPESGFVVAGKNVVHTGLGEAIAAAQEDDTIEVYGNGPYPSPPLQIERKRLTIRAAPGAQPVFVMETPARPSTQPFLTTDSDLQLAGLTIHWSIEATKGKTEADVFSRCVILSTRGPVTLAHCRIVTGWLNGCVGVSGRDVVVKNCHFAGDGSGGVFWKPAPSAKMAVEGSIFEGRAGITVSTVADRTSAPRAFVTLSHNTFRVEKSLQFSVFTGPKQPLDITTRGNIFDNITHCNLIGLTFPKKGDPKATEMIGSLRSVAKWSEEGNVHRRGVDYIITQRVASFLSAEVDSLDRWLNLWELPATKSIEGNIHFHKRDSNSITEPLRLERIDNQSGPVPAKVGADPERVGPGSAYHTK